MAVPAVSNDGTWLTPDFEFVRVLGRGGTGWVALARHVPLDRLVAVKTMNGGSLNASATARVRREGRILAGLKHPGIVTVYQMISVPSSLSLVMEYLPGGDLGKAMDHGDLTGRQLVGVLTQVAGALEAAGAAGIVHRDVKPGNVLLDGKGRAVLADFGLARLQGSTSGFRTMTGTVTGTPLYMAPEQIDSPDAETPAIDAYAFGTLAYRMLTGEYPYSAATLPEIAQAHRSGTPRPPAMLRKALPNNVCHALLGALTKDPAGRTSPRELAEILALTPAAHWDDILAQKAPNTEGAAGVTIGDRPSAATGTNPGQSPPRTDTDGSRATGIDDSVVQPPQATRVGKGPDEPSGGGFRYPDNEKWIEPAVFVLPRGLQRRWIAPVAGVAVGLLIGLLVFLILLNI